MQLAAMISYFRRDVRSVTLAITNAMIRFEKSDVGIAKRYLSENVSVFNQWGIIIKKNIKVVLCIAAICTLSACEKAVREHETVTYQIQGDLNGNLYPIMVEQHSEDVFITLKESAPIPEVFSVDTKGQEKVFLYKVKQNTLIIPGKFDHISLRHAGEKSIEIIQKK